MIEFPSTALVHKELKIRDLFKNFTPSREAKAEATLIKDLVLEYVLNKDTLRCSNPTRTREVYVFVVEMTAQFVPLTFLKEFDRYIQLSTMFVIRFRDLEYTVLSYKNGSVPKEYFHTNWVRSEREPFPIGLDLDRTYRYLFSKLLFYKPVGDETSEEYLKRYNNLTKLDKKIESLESRIRNESQPRKKFEFNDECNILKKEREFYLKGGKAND